jgi:hypothetical protein
MIVDGRGTAEMRRRKSRQDHRRGEYESSMCVRVGTSSQCLVRESSLCPSACLYEDPLQLKRVTSCCCPVLDATEGLNVRMAKLKRIVGQGPVKESLFNENLALHGTIW